MSPKRHVHPEPAQEGDGETVLSTPRTSRRYAVEQAIARARSAQPWHEVSAPLDPASRRSRQRWGEVERTERIGEEVEEGAETE